MFTYALVVLIVGFLTGWIVGGVWLFTIGVILDAVIVIVSSMIHLDKLEREW